MSKMKRMLALLLSVLLVFTFVPWSNTMEVNAASKPKLAKKTATIYVGKTTKIKVKNKPKGAKITYKSLNKKIATVNKKGKVKGKKSGKAKIRVIVKKKGRTVKKLYFKVTVKKKKSNTSTETTPSTPTETTPTTPNNMNTVSEKESFIVSFDTKGGSDVPAQNIIKGALAKIPDIPVKKGYVFSGWYDEDDFVTQHDFSKGVYENQQLYSKWVSESTSVVLKIDSSNLGTCIEGDKTYYVLDREFNGDISGSLAGNIDDVREITYSIRDDSNIEVGSGDVNVEADWRINGANFAIGYNTIRITALLNDGSFSDEVGVVSSNSDDMEKINVDDADDDEDGLNNYIEASYGTSKDDPDTDGDGISDYIEVMTLTGYNPLSIDSDSDGIFDGDEDYDDDGLKNKQEISYGTDPSLEDSDSDGLNDAIEINRYNTDPLSIDTDKDGASDGWEIDNNFNPLEYDNSFEVEVKCADVDANATAVTASVSTDLSGDKVASLNVNPISEEDDAMVSSAIAGYLGQAYEFTVDGSIDSATLTFEYDTSIGELGEKFQPRIYYINETTGEMEELENQKVSNGKVSAEVTHFSKYILLNKVAFEDVWNEDIIPPLASDSDEGEATIDIAFAIDYSLSMDWNDSEQTFKTLSKEFISKLREGKDKAAVVKFIASTTVVQELTDDKEKLNDAIDSIEYDDGYGANSGTNGSDGYKTALTELSKSSASHKFIVFITDGEDNRSSYNYDDLIQESVSNGVVVYTIGMGTASESILKSIAEGTHGKYYKATTSSATDDVLDLNDVFDNIQKETVDVITDSNSDGIPDYFNDLIKSGDLVLSNGSTEFRGIDFNKDQYGNTSPDYDGDGIKNGDELIVNYDEKNNRVSLKMVSSPILKDTDRDGLNDNKDSNPLAWDVSDRDLAMFAALTYEDASSHIGGFYDSSVDEDYYWLNFASIGELSGQWKIVDHVNQWTQAAKLDKFSATTFINGDNVVIAYRGTNDGLMEWLDNILCYGMMNYHAEELLTRQYAEKIYNSYVKGKPNVKLYITGHSLGGYLSQIGASELILNGHEKQLEKVAYFNGIGMKYNKELFWTKNEEIDALKRYGRYADGLFGARKTPNGKLISYHINGDWVSMLGTHYGSEIGFDATMEARQNHAGKHGSYASFWDAIKTFSVTELGLAVGFVAASPKVAFYYGYYHPQSFIEYTWITHETDSFLYHLKNGTRG